MFNPITYKQKMTYIIIRNDLLLTSVFFFPNMVSVYETVTDFDNKIKCRLYMT